MSIQRCHIHDETYDTDFCEDCPRCEKAADWNADVELAERLMVLPVAEFGDTSEQFEVLP